MMYNKNNERSLRAALDGTRHIITKRHAAVEASELNQCVRDTSVEDLNLHFERMKLDFEVLNLPFEGVVHIPDSEEIAMKLATEASEAAFDPSNRFFFIHGASVTNNTQQNEESSTAGAYITYKQATANKDSWITKNFGFGCCRGDEAGLLAISRCLSLAATDLLRTPYQQRVPKITIFTHYQDALHRLVGARNIGSVTRNQGRPRSVSTPHHTDSTTGRVQATPALVEVVKKSRFLCRKLGAKLELQCMPHHATGPERHKLAEAAATSQALPASKTMPTFQRLRQAHQNLKPCHRAYHRRELVHMRRSCRGRPSPLARQAISASSTT